MRKTSLLAYDSVSLENKQYMWASIISALKKMKVGGNYCEIAAAIKAEPVTVARRMNELVQKKIVYNTTVTRPTRTGRQAMVRQLYKRYLVA